MKKYLIVKHWLKGTYTSDLLEKNNLLEMKEHMIEMIIDLENKQYFDPEENKWIDIKVE